MDIELQIVLYSLLALIGIIAVPVGAAWILWKKSGGMAKGSE